MTKTETKRITLNQTRVRLRDGVETFLQLEMSGKSASTERWYRSLLGSLLERLGGEKALDELLEVDLLYWQASLYMNGWSNYTISGHIRVAKRLFAWLKERGIMPVDIGVDLRPPRLPRTARKGISDEDVRRILDAARGHVRDYAMLMFLESTGCRRAGVANLRLEDLNLNEKDERLRRRAFVREKGDKERVVLMTEEAARAMWKWLAKRPYCEDERVFMVEPATVSAIVKKYCNQLGITGKTSPHQWRHRFARRGIQNGLDLSQMAQLLGHESVTITERFYAQFTVDQLQTAYDRANRVE